MKLVKNNLLDYLNNVNKHNSKERYEYDSLLNAYNERNNSLKKLSTTIPAMKVAVANNWLYEVKQDDRIRQIGNKMSTVSNPYYKAVEASMKPNVCNKPTCVEKNIPWVAHFYQDNNWGGANVKKEEGTGDMIKDGDAWIFKTPFGVSSWIVSDYAKLFFTDDVNKDNWEQQPNIKESAGDIDLRYIRIEKIKMLCITPPWKATFYKDDDYNNGKDYKEEDLSVFKEGDAWIFPTPFGVSSWQVSDYAKLYFTDDKNKSNWELQPNNKKAAGDIDLRYIKIEKLKPPT
jgi:uncharacterized cupin superfamily protein